MARIVGALAAVGLAIGHALANAIGAEGLAQVLGPGAVVAVVLWLVISLAAVIHGSEPEQFTWRRRGNAVTRVTERADA